MKQIIIFLLLVIVGIMGYNFYKKYQRFNPPNYEYNSSEAINPNHPDKAMLLDYYQAIEEVNGYVITQWSSNSIDVRNPKKDNAKTKTAVSEYNRKLGNVKFYESQLNAPSKTKEEVVISSEDDNRKILIRKMFYSSPSLNGLRLGERSPLVYEIQRILIEKGDSIRHDGLFRTETFNAIRAFEEKNSLYADGRLDAITLEALLK